VAGLGGGPHRDAPAGFYDAENGGFFMVAADHDPHLFVRAREEADNVEPSAASVAVLNFCAWRSWRTAGISRAARGEDPEGFWGPHEGAAAGRSSDAGCAFFCLGRARADRLGGRPGGPRDPAPPPRGPSPFPPHKVLLLADGGERQAALSRRLPFLATASRKDGKATAYVCYRCACRKPTQDPAEFARQLDEIR